MSMSSQVVRRRGGARAVSTALVAGSALSVALATALVTGMTTGVTSASAAQSAAVRLEATLSGTSAGDPDGAGRAVFRLNRARRTVCATVTWRRIQTPDAAHIHRRSDGGVVVDLTGSVTGGRSCARRVPRPLIRRITTHPRRYYFNVHNATYPAGAIQGILHR